MYLLCERLLVYVCVISIRILFMEINARRNRKKLKVVFGTGN
jgi:hypothetical protein